MLIEQLVINGFKVLSANTDGLVTLVPEDRLQTYKNVCSMWEADTNFELEDEQGSDDDQAT